MRWSASRFQYFSDDLVHPQWLRLRKDGDGERDTAKCCSYDADPRLSSAGRLGLVIRSLQFEHLCQPHARSYINHLPRRWCKVLYTSEGFWVHTELCDLCDRGEASSLSAMLSRSNAVDTSTSPTRAVRARRIDPLTVSLSLVRRSRCDAACVGTHSSATSAVKWSQRQSRGARQNETHGATPKT